MKRNEWKKVVFADDCRLCDCCGEPYCDQCGQHYADCECPGPRQDDVYDYKVSRGVLYARAKPCEY